MFSKNSKVRDRISIQKLALLKLEMGLKIIRGMSAYSNKYKDLMKALRIAWSS
jgi:hypothetical protein